MKTILLIALKIAVAPLLIITAAVYLTIHQGLISKCVDDMFNKGQPWGSESAQENSNAKTC